MRMDKKYFFTSVYDERIAYRLTLSFALMGIIPMLLTTYIISTLWLPALNVWAQVGLVLSFSLAVSLFGYFLSRTIVRTILKTSEIAKEIADGNLSKRIEIRNQHAEITLLADSFNRITAQLEQKIQDVQASEEKYRHLVDNVPDLLYYLEPGGTISSLNDEATELLGYQKQELLGQPISLLVHQDDYAQYEPVLRERRTDKRRLTRGLRIRLKTKKGDLKFFEVNSRGIYSPTGSFLGTEALARDITAQVALETEREEFLYMLTHDIKNPISAILFIVYMMKDGTIPPDKYHDYYGKIEQACNGITGLVADFLEIKKFERGHAILNPQKVNMTSLLKNLVLTYQAEAHGRGKKLSLVTPIGDAKEAVFSPVDERYFPRAVENLITNAIKFAAASIEVGFAVDQNWLSISVRDDGPGIPEEEKEHIFKLFHSAPGSRIAKGIGVGLASAEKIVRAHGGTLTVQSASGKGCTFVITTPQNCLTNGTRCVPAEETLLPLIAGAASSIS